MGLPFVRRGVQFRTRPSSALSNSGVYRPDPGGRTAPAATPAPAPSINPWTARRNARGTTGQQGSGIDTSLGSRDVRSIAATRSAAAAEQVYGDYERGVQANYQSFVNQFMSQYQAGINAQMQPDPEQLEILRGLADIDKKEMELREATLAGDIKEANRLKGEIEANKAAMSSAIQHTKQMAEPQFARALQFASEIHERNTPLTQVNTAAAMGDTMDAYGAAAGTTSTTASQIGAGDAALQAALKIAGGDQDLYLQRERNRGKHTENIIGLTEDAALAETDFVRQTFRRQLMEDEAQNKQHWADEDRQIAKIFEDLSREGERIKLSKKANELNSRAAEMALVGEVEGVDAVQFGQAAASDYLFTNSSNMPLDRAYYLQDVLATAFDELRVTGYSPDAVHAWLNSVVDEETGATIAQMSGITAAEAQLLANAVGVYDSARSQWEAPQSTAPRAVRGTGEAPNNRAHAGDTEGPYRERAEFVSAFAKNVLSEFNVQSLGQWRDLDAEVTADRSANSDHYSGGALDFTGTRQEMERLKSWLEKNPRVSFVRIHGTPPHVHVSFKL